METPVFIHLFIHETDTAISSQSVNYERVSVLLSLVSLSLFPRDHLQYRPKLIGLVFKLLLWPKYSSSRLGIGAIRKILNWGFQNTSNLLRLLISGLRKLSLKLEGRNLKCTFLNFEHHIMRYSLCLCQASVRQSRTVPPAAAAQVSQVAPSAVGLAMIKAEWAAQIASLGQEIPRSCNVQSSDSPCCPAWAPKQWLPSSASSLQQHIGFPHNAQEWCEVQNYPGVFEDPQVNLLWLGEQGKWSRNNDCCWWQSHGLPCLNDLKLPSHVSRLKPLLTPAQKLRRLSWGRKRANWRKKRWNRVLWTDETHIEFWTNTHRIKIKRTFQISTFQL